MRLPGLGQDQPVVVHRRRLRVAGRLEMTEPRMSEVAERRRGRRLRTSASQRSAGGGQLPLGVGDEGRQQATRMELGQLAAARAPRSRNPLVAAALYPCLVPEPPLDAAAV